MLGASRHKKKFRSRGTLTQENSDQGETVQVKQTNLLSFEAEDDEEDVVDIRKFKKDRASRKTKEKKRDQVQQMFVLKPLKHRVDLPVDEPIEQIEPQTMDIQEEEETFIPLHTRRVRFEDSIKPDSTGDDEEDYDDEREEREALGRKWEGGRINFSLENLEEPMELGDFDEDDDFDRWELEKLKASGVTRKQLDDAEKRAHPKKTSQKASSYNDHLYRGSQHAIPPRTVEPTPLNTIIDTIQSYIQEYTKQCNTIQSNLENIQEQVDKQDKRLNETDLEIEEAQKAWATARESKNMVKESVDTTEQTNGIV